MHTRYRLAKRRYSTLGIVTEHQTDAAATNGLRLIRRANHTSRRAESREVDDERTAGHSGLVR